jgi:tetratricopeptide (TPR) repeat protein
MLPSKQRRTIHLDVAQELVNREEVEALCVSIAYHYTQACKDVEDLECDITDNAVFYWERAARDALFKFGQYRTAVRHYKEALQLSNTMGQIDRVDQAQRGTWHRHIAYAHAALGELDSSMEHLKLSLQEIGVHVPATWPRGMPARAATRKRFSSLRVCWCGSSGLKRIVPRKFLDRQSTLRTMSEARQNNTMENLTSLEGTNLLKSHVFYQLASLAVSSVSTGTWGSVSLLFVWHLVMRDKSLMSDFVRFQMFV